MKISKIYMLPAVLILFFSGVFFGAIIMGSLAKSNSIEGYHCAPLKKFTNLEDAKKEVERNQIATGLRNESN